MVFTHLLQYHHNGCLHYLPPPISSSSFSTTTTSTSLFPNSATNGRRRWKTNRTSLVAAGSNPLWVEAWKPDNSPSPPLSDIFWPSAGAFAAMAVLGKVDQMLSPKGVSITIAPLGAVCAVLFSTPSSPAARKYNMFMAQIGCAAIGVLAFSLLGPGWVARSTALAASIAFMIYTRSNHPPAASLPLLFIDGAKLHGLNYWYALFPGAAGCLILCFLVSWLVNGYMSNWHIGLV
ncbi:Transmembrane protein DDB_G0269096 [Linum perenne]